MGCSPSCGASSTSLPDAGSQSETSCAGVSPGAASPLDGLWTDGCIFGTSLEYNGDLYSLTRTSPSAVSVRMFGRDYAATLESDGALHWSDGEVWHRQPTEDGDWGKGLAGQEWREKLEARARKTLLEELLRDGRPPEGSLAAVLVPLLERGALPRTSTSCAWLTTLTTPTAPTSHSTIMAGDAYGQSAALAELLGRPASVLVRDQPTPLEEALGDAQYLVVCFSASYCPSCKKFMPALEYANLQGGLSSSKRCKILLVGGDKTAEAFNEYRAKYPQFLSLSFDDTQPLKAALRESWHISTIPHVVLLDRQSAEVVQRNVRFHIEGNPRCDGFPWAGQPEADATVVDIIPQAHDQTSPEIPDRHWTLRERLWKRPRCYQLGHHAKPGSSAMYMDESAVRARAGLLNLTSWIAIVNIFLWEERELLYALWPIVAWDMLAAALFGLTPLSPYGLMGTLLAFVFGPAEPHWKPAGPKRFAWIIGFFLVNACGLAAVLKVRPLMIVAVLMCNAATWAESSLGFCVGCWTWNTLIAPQLGKQACQECKL